LNVTKKYAYEDFLLREIDRLGEMLMLVARKLGLVDPDSPDYTLSSVREEFSLASLPIDVDTVLSEENPVWYLVENEHLSDKALESFVDILFHSDLDEERKRALLSDTLAYLDGKGYYSFTLHSYDL
jgi:hypothetical protein